MWLTFDQLVVVVLQRSSLSSHLSMCLWSVCGCSKLALIKLLVSLHLSI